MKFNSQICTTKEQSERLLALGLKKETADCIWCEVRTLSKDNPIQWHLLPEYIDKHDEKHIPAWSLHRLIEMMPPGYREQIRVGTTDKPYEYMYQVIGRLVSVGELNKEYLK